MYLLIIFVLNRNVHSHITRGNNDLHVTVVNKNYSKKNLKHKATVLWNGLSNILKKVSSIKKFTQQVIFFCGQQTSTVRISSLVCNVMNYYSVTDNIFQLIVDFWHMLLVNDDDVGFSLAFLYDFAMFCIFKNILYIFLCACECVHD